MSDVAKSLKSTPSLARIRGAFTRYANFTLGGGGAPRLRYCTANWSLKRLIEPLALIAQTSGRSSLCVYSCGGDG
jgi:hypothetical protein